MVLRVLLQVDGQVGAHHAFLAAHLVERAGHHGARALFGQVVLHLLAGRHRLARLARQSHQRAGRQVGLGTEQTVRVTRSSGGTGERTDRESHQVRLGTEQTVSVTRWSGGTGDRTDHERHQVVRWDWTGDRTDRERQIPGGVPSSGLVRR